MILGLLACQKLYLYIYIGRIGVQILYINELRKIVIKPKDYEDNKKLAINTYINCYGNWS